MCVHACSAVVCVYGRDQGDTACMGANVITYTMKYKKRDELSDYDITSVCSGSPQP